MIALPTMAPAAPRPVVWFRTAREEAFPRDGGACVLAGSLQIAVFRFARRGAWYACQNLCPHRGQMALARGLLGSTTDGVAKVACPFHKASFSLETGECLSGECAPVRVYPVRVENGWVYVGLPADATA